MEKGYEVTSERALEIFEIMRALLTGHFVFTEGQHSGHYFQLRMAFAYPWLNSELALGVAERMVDWGVETLVAPPYGAIGLVELVALHLSDMTDKKVNAAYLIRDEKDPKVLLMPPWAREFVAGRECAIIEDTVSTGTTIQKVEAVINKTGGTAVGGGCICDRRKVRDTLGMHAFTSIVEANHPAWSAEECAASQLCAKGVPIRTDVGHGKEFLAKQEQ